MPVSHRLNQPGIQVVLTSPSGGVTRDMLRRGIRVQNQARRLCPVDTGRLRASIGVSQRRASNGGVMAVVGTNVEYALYVHEGTRYMVGRPFLRDALQAAR